MPLRGAAGRWAALAVSSCSRWRDALPHLRISALYHWLRRAPAPLGLVMRNSDPASQCRIRRIARHVGRILSADIAPIRLTFPTASLLQPGSEGSYDSRPTPFVAPEPISLVCRLPF